MAFPVSSSSISKALKINDSVFEVYKPADEESRLDVIFFHGLYLESTEPPNAIHFDDTWKGKCGESSLWPQEWLPEDFPQAKVFVVSYLEAVDKGVKEGRMDLCGVAEKVLGELLSAGIGQLHSVVLVGHSMGGILMKQCCLSAHLAVTSNENALGVDVDLLQTFLQNVKGIFYYATPHMGMAHLEELFWSKKTHGQEGVLVKFAHSVNEDVLRLKKDFDLLPYGWKQDGVGEVLPTDLGDGRSVPLVSEESARGGACSSFLYEDHTSICQPSSPISSSYILLVDFIQEIEEARTVRPGDYQKLPECQVGLMRASALRKFIKSFGNHQVIGLWGGGGLGKTALSKAVFNQLHSSFECTLFVERIKEVNCDDEEFEEVICADLHEKGTRVNKLEGYSMTSRVRGKKLLAVLDDFENERERNFQCKLCQLSASDSMILLTSRDKRSLLQVGKINIIPLDVLDVNNSVRLLEGHAFFKDQVATDWHTRSMERICKCSGGLPLRLQIIGEYLKGKSDEVWQDTVRSLMWRDGNLQFEDQLWSTLRKSYDALDDEEKDMFREAATVFQTLSYQWLRSALTLAHAKLLWSARFNQHATHWERLVETALVHDVSEQSPVTMYNHLRDMGEHFAKERGEVLRLYVDKFNVGEEIKLSKSIRALEVIPTKDLKMGLQCFDSECKGKLFGSCVHTVPVVPLANLQELRYLLLEDCDLAGESPPLPRNLIYLSSTGSCNLGFHECKSLVFLTLSTNDKKSLPNAICNLKNLRILELTSSSIQNLPDCFGLLENLEWLSLRSDSMKRLPDSFGNLRNLQHLEVSCKNLHALPNTFGRMTSLQILSLESLALQQLPSSFGELVSLQRLRIRAAKLESLPETFGGLCNLQEMLLDGYHLVNLPETFGNLSSLQMLRLEECPLDELPESFENLLSLQKLEIYDSDLKTLPWSFGRLHNLHVLKLIRCRALETLPEALAELANLHEMNLVHAQALENLPMSFGRLQNLQTLELNGCAELKSLPDSISTIKSLRYLGLDDCINLRSLPDDIGNLNSLETLSLGMCTNLKRVPNSFHLLRDNLKWLKLDVHLENIVDAVADLEHLEVLQLRGDKIKSLPDEFFKGLLSLLQLKIDCSELEEIPKTIGNLQMLRRLEIWGCEALRRLPGTMKELRRLKQLTLSYCPELELESGFEPWIENVDVFCCRALESSPVYLGWRERVQPAEDGHRLNKREKIPPSPPPWQPEY